VLGIGPIFIVPHRAPLENPVFAGRLLTFF
jgi:hypothetical protein